MGDGRYYTYYQFFDVILITFLAMFAIGSILYCHYRKNTDTDIFHIYLSFSLIILFSILKIVETIIPNLVYASILRNVELGVLLLLLNLVLINNSIIKHNKRKIIPILIVLLMIIAFTEMFIISYKFHDISYSYFYKGLLGISFVIISIFSIRDIFITTKNEEFSSNKVISGFRFLFLVIPAFAYLIIVINNRSYTCYFEILLAISYTIYLDFMFNMGSESSLSMLAFDKIGDMSTNYIFVIDTSYKLIYKNEAVQKSGFFAGVENIDISNITAIFIGDSIKNSTHFGKEYIRLKIGSEKNYFTYKIVSLNHNEEDIGYIITITNLTDLIKLLIDLENKKEQSKSANERLKNHSKVVYHLEKEKEINNLLEEIVSSRDEQMKYLSELISDTKDKIDDEHFEKYIDVSIKKSNEILEEVRLTVSKYREYYGG